MVSFTPRLLYPQEKSSRYQLDRRVGGPQSLSGHGVEEKTSQPPPGIEPRSSHRPAPSQSLYRKLVNSNLYFVTAAPVRQKSRLPKCGLFPKNTVRTAYSNILLQTQIYYEANHASDITLHRVINYFVKCLLFGKCS
jgi:hypothetical protein